MSNVAYRSFQSGELSPAMYARTDLQRYVTGLRTLRNATVLRTGGVQSRAGFEYLGSTKANGAARLVEAVFDDDANYVLEFGNLYIRFWKDGALVDVGTPAAWLTATAYTAGLVRAQAGTNYVCLVAHTSGTFATDLAAGKWYALTGTIYEWPTDYVTADLFELQVAYQLNVVTIVHPTYPPATLTRTSDAVWALADVEFSVPDEGVTNIAVSGSAGTGWGYSVVAEFGSGFTVTTGPTVAFVRTNINDTNITNYNSTMSVGGRTVTWTAVSGATGYTILLNRVAGETVYIQRVGAVTTYADSGGWGASTSAYSWYTSNLAANAPFSAAGKYPAVVGAYQQRLLLSGTTDAPDVVQASTVASPYNFFESSPILDSDPMEWRQVGRRFNRVRHFAEVAQRLIQFSSVGESIIQGDTDGVLRPGEVNPRQFSENGAALKPPPLVINDSALYVQARGGIVRDIAPIQASGFTGSDLTLQSAHLVDGYTMMDWTYQQTPNSVVWVVRDDGTLLSLTYVRELGILGWATHDTDGFVESVCCVPEGSVDSVYAVIRRTIDGNTKRYIERMSDRLADTVAIADSHSVTTAYNTPEAGTIYIEEYDALQYTATLSDDAFAESEVGNLFAAQDPASGDNIKFTLDSVTGATTSALQHYARDIAWAEYLTLFVCVHGRNISTSPDGINWTLQYTSAAVINPEWNSIAVSESLGRIVVVGTGGNIAYSDNGIAWTEPTIPSGTTSWAGVCWGEGAGLFVTVAYNDTNRAMHSLDGITWTLATSAPPLRTWFAVVYSEDDSLFVAVANSGTNTSRVMTSPDGDTWTSRTTPNIDVGWLSIKVNPATGRMVAVGQDVLSAGQAVMTSDNGTAWTARSTATLSRTYWERVVYSDTFGAWVAVAFANVVTPEPIMASYDDGVTWAALAEPLPLSGNADADYTNMTAIAVSDSLGVFVTGLNTRTDTFTSADGLVFVRNDASQSAIISFAEAPPATLLYDNISPWYRGFITVTGLGHLEGESVSVYADGVVVASPNNAEYATITVSGGSITLASPALAVVVGLPYTTDIQTLDIDSVGTTIKDRGVQVGGVICWVEDTGKFYAGPVVPMGDTLTGLEAFVPTNDQGYATTSNVTGVAEVTLQATYNNTGRVLIRQVDPTPLTILSIAPTGFLNGGR